MNLLEVIIDQFTPSIIDGLSEKLGTDKSTVQKTISDALPVLLGSLGKNASKENEASSLDKALNKHDGSLLNNLEDILAKPDTGDENDSNILKAEGMKILGHILKGKEDTAAKTIGSSSNTDSSTAKNIMAMLGPIVLENLGKVKKEKGLDAKGLTDMIAEEVKSGNILNNPIAKALLDQDGDGKVGFGDIFKILGKFFK